MWPQGGDGLPQWRDVGRVPKRGDDDDVEMIVGNETREHVAHQSRAAVVAAAVDERLAARRGRLEYVHLGPDIPETRPEVRGVAVADEEHVGAGLDLEAGGAVEVGEIFLRRDEARCLAETAFPARKRTMTPPRSRPPGSATAAHAGRQAVRPRRLRASPRPPGSPGARAAASASPASRNGRST